MKDLILTLSFLLLLETIAAGFQTPSLGLKKKHVLFAKSEPSSFRKITIPQRYPKNNSPLHDNPYPSAFHSIHVGSLLSGEQSSKCLQLAKEYAEETKCWESKDSERHASYSTADFPIEDCDALQSYLDEIDFEKNTFRLLAELFNVEPRDLSFMDLFCAHYTGKNDIDTDPIMDHLDLHRDGSEISFTIVLNHPDDYMGGGTEFDALKDAVGPEYMEFGDILQQDGVLKVQKPGQSVIHCGKILHGAHIVSSGERTTLTGFVQLNSRCTRKGVLGEACKHWGRMDNVSKRLERQIKMVGHVDEDKVVSKGWASSSSKFLGSADASANRSYLKGFIPAFSSVQKRGKLFRNKNLETEDILLRDICLCTDEDRIDPIDIIDLSQFGDVTVL